MIAHAHLGLTAPLPLTTNIGLQAHATVNVVAKLGLAARDHAADSLGLSGPQPPPPIAVGAIGLALASVSAGWLGVAAVAVLAGKLGVTDLSAAIGKIGLHDCSAVLPAFGSVVVSALIPAFMPPAGSLGVEAPQASTSGIGLTSIGEFPRWAVGSIGLTEVTPAAAAIGIVGGVAGEFGVSFVSAIVPKGGVGLVSLGEVPAWAHGSVGLDGTTPAVAAIVLDETTPSVEGASFLEVVPRSFCSAPASQYAAVVQYFNGEWTLSVTNFTSGGASDSVTVLLSFDTWYDLIVVDDGGSISATIGSSTASLTFVGDNDNPGVEIVVYNPAAPTTLPVQLDLLQFSSAAGGVLWSDNFDDVDGTPINVHAANIRPGITAYISPAHSMTEIWSNRCVVPAGNTTEGYAVFWFNPGTASAVSTVTTVVRFRVVGP